MRATRVRSDQWVGELSDHLCECGCGERTMVAPRTYAGRGIFKGQPRRFVRGHQIVAARAARPRRFRLVIVKVRGRRRCACGCGLLPSSKNARFASGHAPRHGGVSRPRKAVRWVAEDRGFETPCHIWQLGVDKRGYGKVSVRGKRLKAHRVAFEEAGGVIPADYDVHHRCEVKLCVNAEHLLALTHEEHGALHGEVWRRA